MLSIDNAVELMIKTYLGLPKRITDLDIPRRDLQEIAESFPRMLAALERYAADKLAGIDLAEMEWYHRLRNELYHQGNGLTVERNKVEVYAELARILFRNLFGYDLEIEKDQSQGTLGDFISAWARLEKTAALLLERLSYHETRIGLRATPAAEKQEIDQSATDTALGDVSLPLPVTDKGRRYYTSMYREQYWRRLADWKLIDKSRAEDLIELRELRNKVVHGDADYRTALQPEMVETLNAITNDLRNNIARIGDQS
jgi:hypothetical protein